MQKTLAIILKKQNLGETDRIITIFSPVIGKKRVIAKAVRKPLSKMSGHLDTMMLSQIILTNEDELPKITSAVLIEPFQNIRSSLDLLQKSFAVTKVVERVILEDVSQQTIFQLTLDALMRIDSLFAWNNIWLHFLSELTDELGIGLTDFSCVECGNLIQDNALLIIPDRRFICTSCETKNEDVIKMSKNSIKLTKFLTKNNFEQVKRLQIPDTVAREVEEVFLREITQWFNKPWQNYRAIS